MKRSKATTIFLVVLTSVAISIAGFAHTHYGNSNISVTPTTVTAGGPIAVGFSYKIWHDHGWWPSNWPNPWEIRLDGSPGVRNGLLLASGTKFHPATGQTLTFSVSTSVVIPPGTSAGNHTIKILTSVDPNWYYSYYRCSHVTIKVSDTTPPSTAFTSVPLDPDDDGTPAFAWIGADDYSAAANLVYSTNLDGGGWSGWGSATVATIGPLAEGAHTFQVRAMDEAGNVEATASHTWFVDLTAPSTEFTFTPPAPDNNPSPAFTWSGSDNHTASANLVYSTSLDGGGWSGWGSATVATIGPLAEGAHTFQVRAMDEAGNVEATASYTWFVDLTPPVITVYEPAMESVYMLDSIAYASWTVADEATDVARVVATARDGRAIPTGWPGGNTFRVTATDVAGNEAVVEVEYTVVYTVIPGGAVGGGGGVGDELRGFLDQSIAGGGGEVGGVELEATYAVGQPLIISFDVLNVFGEQYQHGAASATLMRIPEEGSEEAPEILRLEAVRFIAESGLYTLTLDPILEAGTYDLWLGFTDGTIVQLRIQVT